MKRRQFLGLIGGAAAWPLAARAEQARPAGPVIGFLSTAAPAPFTHLAAAFRQGMQEKGFIEGRNIAIEYRWAEGHLDRMPALAGTLVERKVDLIAAFSPIAVLAARNATSTIPIVMTSGDDPVRLGLVASLNRPGGNITGVSLLNTALSAKRHELLRELVPAATVIGLLVNPGNPNTEVDVEDARRAAQVIGWRILTVSATTADDLEPAFKRLVEQQAAAVVIGTDQFFNSIRDRLVGQAAQHRLPVIYQVREFAAAGGLLSYGPSLADAYRQAGVYAGRVLQGERPGELPVMQPVKYELVINLKTAKAQGLEIPPMLLARADEVIE